MRRQLIGGLAALLLGPVACDEGGLGSSDFRGEPLVQLGARDMRRTFIGQPDLRVTVFWFTDGPEYVAGMDPGDAAVVAHAESIPVGDDLDVVLPLFEPPPEAVRVRTAQGGHLAAGHLAVWRDVDGDGAWGAGEPIVGAATGRSVLYLVDDHDAQRSPTTRPLAQGYHNLRAPMLCGSVGPAEPGDCGVSLSASCTADADCGAGGVCLTRLGQPIQAGACAIAEPPPAGCRPAESSLQINPGPGPVGYYLATCDEDEDCPEQGQACEVGDQVCATIGQTYPPLDEPRHLRTPCIGPMWMGPPPPP